MSSLVSFLDSDIDEPEVIGFLGHFADHFTQSENGPVRDIVLPPGIPRSEHISRDPWRYRILGSLRAGLYKYPELDISYRFNGEYRSLRETGVLIEFLDHLEYGDGTVELQVSKFHDSKADRPPVFDSGSGYGDPLRRYLVTVQSDAELEGGAADAGIMSFPVVTAQGREVAEAIAREHYFEWTEVSGVVTSARDDGSCSSRWFWDIVDPSEFP